MKKQSALAIAVIMFHLSAWSQYLPPQPQISVSGSAEVKVAPDEIYLNVGVETRSANPADAKSQNDENISQALKFLKAQGIKDKDIQTDFLSVQPEYVGNSPTINFYSVQKNITAKLTNTTNFEAVLTGLLSNGVNYVHGISFRTSELRKYRDQARGMAVRAAKEKAEAMASATGVKLGKIYSVNVNDGGGWISWGGGYWGGGGMYQGYQNSVQNAGGDSETEGAFAIGQISVSASVNVSYLIQ
jgi:uncharacterized protein YggE